eukprot:TRINITY_DN9522_c3_g2_i1.p1 TRINITY_DN9522_c3_g2~~TRINITY_DN9522_c3_g2_i1.p1  ORF type:complete len:828 (+),score=229.22 TRINITY_DN9522_c3_g2_i1:142-2484(+)
MALPGALTGLSAAELEAQLMAGAVRGPAPPQHQLQQQLRVPDARDGPPLRGRITDLQGILGEILQERAFGELPQVARDRICELQAKAAPQNPSEAGVLYHELIALFARLRRHDVFGRLNPKVRREIEAWTAAAAAAAALGKAPEAGRDAVGDIMRPTWPVANQCHGFVPGDECIFRYSVNGTCFAKVYQVLVFAGDGHCNGKLVLRAKAPALEERHAAEEAEALQVYREQPHKCGHYPRSVREAFDRGHIPDIFHGFPAGEEIPVELPFQDVAEQLRLLDYRVAELEGMPGMDKFVALREPKAIATGPRRADGGSQVWSAGGAKWGGWQPPEAETQAIERCATRLAGFGEVCCDVDLLWRACWGPNSNMHLRGKKYVERYWVLGQWLKWEELPNCLDGEMKQYLWQQGKDLSRRLAERPNLDLVAMRTTPQEPPHALPRAYPAVVGAEAEQVAAGRGVNGARRAADAPPSPPGQPTPSPPPVPPSRGPGTIGAARLAALPAAPQVRAPQNAGEVLIVPAAVSFKPGDIVEIQRPKLAPRLHATLGKVLQVTEKGRVIVQTTHALGRVSFRGSDLRRVPPEQVEKLVQGQRPAAQPEPEPVRMASAAPGSAEPPNGPAPFTASVTPFFFGGLTQGAGTAARARKQGEGREHALGGEDAARDETPAAFSQRRGQGEERARADGSSPNTTPQGAGHPNDAGAEKPDNLSLQERAKRDEWQLEWAEQVAAQKEKTAKRKAAGENYQKAAGMMRCMLIPGADSGRRPFSAGRGRPNAGPSTGSPI